MSCFGEHTAPHPEANTAETPRPSRPVIGQTFDAVLFDMDGTLIDSTPAVRRSWDTWCSERGLDPSFLDGAHGQPARDIVASLVPTEEFDDAFRRIQQIEIAEVEGITVLPGAAEALSAIGECRKAIVTSCTRPLARARITASQLMAPRTVVTADDVQRGKPDPEPFALGAQRLGFDASRCLVVEDAAAGLRSARDAGCTTLAVTGTVASAHLHADLVIGSLLELEFSTTADGIHISRSTPMDRPFHQEPTASTEQLSVS